MNTPGGIAVVYAPNGTGKSSLTRVLETETATEEHYFSAIDDAGVVITPESRAFHIIQDQVNRNVIHGKETDYLVAIKSEESMNYVTRLIQFSNSLSI